MKTSQPQDDDEDFLTYHVLVLLPPHRSDDNSIACNSYMGSLELNIKQAGNSLNLVIHSNLNQLKEDSPYLQNFNYTQCCENVLATLEKGKESKWIEENIPLQNGEFCDSLESSLSKSMYNLWMYRCS